jgi:signal transduction histidine kinase
MGIRAKLVLIFFAIIIVPMFILWAIGQRTTVNSIKSDLRQRLSDRTLEVSDQITTTLDNHQQEILKLMSQEALNVYARNLAQAPQAALDNNLVIDLSAFMLAHHREYSALIGVNRQGTPVFKIETPGLNGVKRPYLTVRDFSGEDVVRIPNVIATTKKGSLYISEIQQDTDRGEPHVKIIAPLRDDADNPSGALVFKLQAERMLSEAAGPRASSLTGRSGNTRPEVIILSPEGIVLYAADEKKRWLSYQAAFKELERPLTVLRPLKNNAIDWQPWLIRHRLREASPQLSIFVVENYSNAISALEINSYVLLLITFLLVIVAMLTLYYLVSGITDSIRRVTKGAKAISTGNLSYQINIKAKDETRVLADTFNRMSDRLRDMIRKEGEQKQFEAFARLSSLLAHDLKNQILSLSLLVSNMERKFDREGFKEDAMRTLSDSVNNLSNLVAKLSDPRTPAKRIRESSNLTNLVERVIQRTAGQVTNRYKISAELAPELYATVDGKAIERVIENLVINALEAMPDGGSLKVSTVSDNGNAIISVSDTGKGMTEDFMRERLFQPFATTKKKGIGLGLYSCRDIIEQHGGYIDVNSKIDTGTEFKVVLPLRVEEQKPIEVEAVTV